MSGKQAIIAVLALALGVAAQAAAQDEPNQLTGMIGRIFISDQGIHGPNAPTINPFVRSGKGLTFEVNYSRRLLGTPILALSGEVLGTFNLDEDLNSGGDVVPSSYKQYFLTPGVRLNLFPSTVLSPWVGIGGGLAHFSESRNLNYYGTNPGGSTNSGVLEAGLGVDLNPFEHRARQLGFRAEVRDFWSGEPDFPLADTGKTRQHNYFVAGGVVWHF
jgi:opacity protein-like surface antigen